MNNNNFEQQEQYVNNNQDHNYNQIDNNNFPYIEQEVVKEKRSYFKLFFTIFLSFVLGALSVFGMQNFSNSIIPAGTSKVTVTKEEKETQETTINAVSKAKDAVVSVVNYQRRASSNSSLSIFSTQRSNDLNVASNGSGVIYKKAGNIAYIVTNEHVVSGAEKISVVLSDGTSVDAELIGKDIWTDLAVLKINSNNVTVVMDFANSDNVAVGETALAIGSPLGLSLSNSVTKGIVSAIDRQIPIDIDKDGVYDWYQTVLQTDAAINPGNSGGALINNAGELIGINELKITNTSQSTSAEGIGFVIPANEVKIITEQLEKTGKVTRPALGVQIVPVSSLNESILKGTINYSGTKGVVLKSVEEGSSAQRAGLKEYDVITQLNDTKIDGVADFRKYIFEKTKIGDELTITYVRLGEEFTTRLTLGTL